MSAEPEQRDLEQLFDVTAESADATMLERFETAARRAAPRTARSRQLRLWAPAALAAAAAGLWLYARSPAVPRETTEARTGLASAGATEPKTPRASVSARVAVLDDDTNAETEDDDSADVFDDLALDPGELSETEIDAWISAASSTLDG